MMQKATLRLFNAIQVSGKRTSGDIPQAVLERTIRNGYILDPAIQPDEALLDVVESVVGISGEKANAAFHKSWAVVQDAAMEQLVIQQIVHYLTTYAFEALGIGMDYAESASRARASGATTSGGTVAPFV